MAMQIGSAEPGHARMVAAGHARPSGTLPA
jgi:hypothetical protein